MKKILLIPTALITGLVPVISLASCNKIDDYHVLDEEFRQIISLVDVELMQTAVKDYEHNFEASIEYSDNVSHKIQTSQSGEGGDQTYYEAYVRKNADLTFTKWERSSIGGPFDGPIQAWAYEYESIVIMGKNMTDIYDAAIEYEFPILFDENKKCYSISGVDLEAFTYEFYFFKKQLVSTKAYIDHTFCQDVTFTYDQITPVPPTTK